MDKIEQTHFMTVDGEIGPRIDVLMRMMECVDQFFEDVRAGKKKLSPLVPAELRAKLVASGLVNADDADLALGSPVAPE